MEKDFNPFLLSGYKGPVYFCDREKETAIIRQNIVNGINTTLFAIRRVGKTGLIQHVFNSFSGNSKIACIYVDILSSKLYKFIFKICKWSGFNIDTVFKNIPYIEKFNNDDELYDYFKLTRKEINLIEENTKGFDKITGGLNKNKYKKYKLSKHYLNKKPKHNSI